MNCGELDLFLEQHPEIECGVDLENQKVLFRNTRLLWYRNDPERVTSVTYARMNDLSTTGLLDAINRGLEVEGITRITGYMTKVSQWNPGKQAELRDRRRTDLQGRAPHHVPESAVA